MELKFEIDQEVCALCMSCVRSCPSASTIQETSTGLVINAETCIKCGHCASLCSSNAISCNGEKLSDNKVIDISSNDFYNLILQKRSTRQYKNQDIPELELKKLIEIISASPTASNNRSMKLAILKGDEVFQASKHLAHLMQKELKLIQNPVVKLLWNKKIPKSLKEPAKLQKFIDVMGETVAGKKDRMFFKAPVVMVLMHHKGNKAWGRTDCAIAGTQAMLYAENHGINSCMVGFAERFDKNAKARELLKIPENYTTGLVFTLGYGVEKYQRVPIRNIIEIL